MTKKTQHEKIILHMLQQRPQIWFYPPDFMRSGMGDTFVGYEASARFSELASDYPDMIESRRKERYLERRIRLEAVGDWWETIPDSLKQIFEANGISPATLFV